MTKSQATPPLVSFGRIATARALSERPFSFLSLNRRRHGSVFQIRLPILKPPLIVFSGQEELREIERRLQSENTLLTRANAYSLMMPALPKQLLLRLRGSRYKEARKHWIVLLNMAADMLSSVDLNAVVALELSAASNKPYDFRKLASKIAAFLTYRLIFGDSVYPLKGLNGPAPKYIMYPGGYPDLFISALGKPMELSKALLERSRRKMIFRKQIRTFLSMNSFCTDYKPQQLLSKASELGMRHADIDTFARTLYAGSSTMLEHAFYFLATKRDAAAELQESVLSNDYANESLLTSFASEVWRMSPDTFGFLRIAKKSINIAKWSVPRGSCLLASGYLTHRDKSIYENPNQFCLRRFLDVHYSSTEYFPFGFGNQTCLGQKLAKEIVVRSLKAILRQYVISGSPGSNNPVSHTMGGVTRRSRPINVTASPTC